MIMAQHEAWTGRDAAASAISLSTPTCTTNWCTSSVSVSVRRCTSAMFTSVCLPTLVIWPSSVVNWSEMRSCSAELN